jgi:hypothetical protein
MRSQKKIIATKVFKIRMFTLYIFYNLYQKSCCHHMAACQKNPRQSWSRFQQIHQSSISHIILEKNGFLNGFKKKWN